MREIIFKAKRTDNGEWAEGYYYTYLRDDNKQREYCILQDISSLFSEFAVKYVDPSTIGQYTGLKDKNGKMIFEGDIVVLPSTYPYFCYPKGTDKSVNEPLEGEVVPNYIGIVEWIYSQWQVVLHCVNPNKRGISEGMNEGLNDVGVEDGENSEWEIIGNIHDEPTGEQGK